MAESTLSLSSTQLRSEVGQLLGYGRSYYKSTVSVSSGVTTLTDTTQVWPTDAANWYLVVSNTGWKRYSVNTRDSATQITLDNTAITGMSAVNYVLEPWSDAQRDDINAAIEDGLRRFYGARDWHFLNPSTSLSTVAPYSTGTITVASGVVTLSSGTFPSWAASGELTIDATGITYEVSTRDSNTQVTLVDTSVTQATASNYEIAQTIYSLPDDFGGMKGEFIYRTGTQVSRSALKQLDPVTLRTIRQERRYSAPPEHFCIFPNAYDSSDGQRFSIEFLPAPDAAYKFYYYYVANPDDLTNEFAYPLGGMWHAQAIKFACLLSAEEMHMEDRAPRYAEPYQRALAASFEMDGRMMRSTTVGYIGDPGDHMQIPPAIPTRDYGGTVTVE